MWIVVSSYHNLDGCLKVFVKLPNQKGPDMFSTLLYTDTRMHFVQPIPSDEPMMVSETSIRKPLDVEASGPMDLFQGWPTDRRPQWEWNQKVNSYLPVVLEVSDPNQ